MEELLQKYKKIRNRLNAFSYAMYVISWDSETEAPKGCFENRSNQIGELVSMMVEISHSDEYVNTVKTLFENKGKLSKDESLEIEKVYEYLMKEIKIPENELIEYEILLSKANQVWCDAKLTNNYELFKPVLEQIINWQRKYISYLETEELQGYNVLLNDYEKGFTMKEYDEFFNALKKDLVPFVKEITSKNIVDDSFITKKYYINKQREFAMYLMDVMCFDKNYGLTKESEHPFTSGNGTTDVRVTTHYYENLITSSIFSMIHELGHGTYERQCDPKYDNTALSGGATMAMHESQSRFYENIIGRDYTFWQVHFPKLKEIYKEQFRNVTFADFYNYINKVEASFIRTEADELTYPIHVMLRYELEKQLIDGTLEVKDLEQAWNDKIKQYFNIEVPCSSKGVLQDSHWSGGSIGYFPTYALGSAIASQLYYKMNEEFDVNQSLLQGNTKQINEWLNNKIHKFGSSKYPKEILEKAINDKFDVNYYINYLIEKYSKIYNLN